MSGCFDNHPVRFFEDTDSPCSVKYNISIDFTSGKITTLTHSALISFRLYNTAVIGRCRWLIAVLPPKSEARRNGTIKGIGHFI
ncbi:hypothetical protein X801_07912 [Opisthorchis viverrini]|uniref:Uncharacterized protein n=1 Tax=Opisthorchis viverrini TaxID=6198 RepID=A0A1S8WPG1_OPIVI|nr:hypothetical protein X801_07912 [Opisthorchis viverrini]